MLGRVKGVNATFDILLYIRLNPYLQFSPGLREPKQSPHVSADINLRQRLPLLPLNTPAQESHQVRQRETHSRGHCPHQTKQMPRRLLQQTWGFAPPPHNARPHPSQPELQHPRLAPPRTAQSLFPLRLSGPTAQARGARVLSRPAAGVWRRCYLLRRRPREPADPGLVAKSDVVSRIKTEEGRKPAVRSSGSSGGPSSRSVPEAPGGLSAEAWSRPPSSPPRRLLSGRVSVSPFSHRRLLAHLPLTPVFLGGSSGFRGLRRLRLSKAASPARWFLGGAGDSAPGETRCCRARVPRRRARRRA